MHRRADQLGHVFLAVGDVDQDVRPLRDTHVDGVGPVIRTGLVRGAMQDARRAPFR